MCSLWQMRLQVEKQMIFAIAVAPDRLMVKRNRWCKIAVPHSAILMRFIITIVVSDRTLTNINTHKDFDNNKRNDSVHFILGGIWPIYCIMYGCGCRTRNQTNARTCSD